MIIILMKLTLIFQSSPAKLRFLIHFRTTNSQHSLFDH